MKVKRTPRRRKLSDDDSYRFPSCKFIQMKFHIRFTLAGLKVLQNFNLHRGTVFVWRVGSFGGYLAYAHFSSEGEIKAKTVGIAAEIFLCKRRRSRRNSKGVQFVDLPKTRKKIIKIVLSRLLSRLVSSLVLSNANFPIFFASFQRNSFVEFSFSAFKTIKMQGGESNLIIARESLKSKRKCAAYDLNFTVK